MLLIGGYRRFISPMTGPHCRFVPSCSAYAFDAVLQTGRLPLRWDEVIPAPRAHSRRKLQDALRNGIAPAEIVKQPAVQLRRSQVALYPVDISAHV